VRDLLTRLLLSITVRGGFLLYMALLWVLAAAAT